MKNIAIIIACIVTLYGCVTTDKYGTDFFMSDTMKIEKGTTTKADILNIFGEPYKKEITKGGAEIWTYSHIETDTDILTKKSKSHIKTLIIEIQNNVVVNFDHLEKYENR